MNTFKFAISSLKRDWVSGELRLIGFSILIAIASLSSVNFFTDRVERATEQQATELLAADLVISSAEPIESALIDKANNLNLITSLSTTFRSVVIKGDSLELAEVKAVDENYPIRGELRTTDKLFGLEKTDASVPAIGSVWLDSRLLQALNASINDYIQLGKSQFKIDKVLTYEPDRGGDLFNIAPRLLMNMTDLNATGLILPGSRVKHHLSLGGEPDSISQYRDELDLDDNSKINIKDIKEARPEIKRALERAEQFLGLAALVSIALAGLAIAMSAQRYAKRHYNNCAIMRCIGLKQKQIINIYCIQLILIGLIFSLMGCVIGFIAQEFLDHMLKGITQTGLPAPSVWPLISGISAGLIAIFAFALPQLLQLRKVSALRVLRRDLDPLPLNNIFVYSIGFIALMLLTPWQSGKTSITFYVIAGLILTAFILSLAAKGMIILLKRIQPRLKIEARYGIANVIRRSNQSIMQIIGIGIGVTAILLLTLVRTDLLANWQGRLPPDTPNYFLINIQADQVKSINQYLSSKLNKEVQLYPMVRGRLTHINANAVDADQYDNDRAKRLATREFNLSYADTMQIDNKLVSGQWWSSLQEKPVFSVEEGIAETLGVKQGDTLTYLIGGDSITGEVINLRWVEWDSFNVNFFVVGNPAAFTNFPGTFIGSFFLPKEKRSMLIDIVRQYPSVTVFDVDAILAQIKVIMEQVVNTIEFVFLFTLLTGLMVLIAALQSTQDERTHEAALMRSLGASQKQILSGLIAEFLCLGLVTGLLSACMATLIEIAMAHFIFKIDISINPLLWLVAPFVCCLMIVITGLFGTRQIISRSPMLILREI